LLETAAITTQPLVALGLRTIEYPVTFEFVLTQLNWIALLETAVAVGEAGANSVACAVVASDITNTNASDVTRVV